MDKFRLLDVVVECHVQGNSGALRSEAVPPKRAWTSRAPGVQSHSNGLCCICVAKVALVSPTRVGLTCCIQCKQVSE